MTSKLPQFSFLNYSHLGLHFDQKLSWQTHIKAKRRQLELKVRNMKWLIHRKSQLSLENKITIYKAIIKPVWTYGIQLWGCSKPSNTNIFQTFQSKTLRKLANAPWYISNVTLHNDLRRSHKNICEESQKSDHTKQPINKRHRSLWDNKRPVQSTWNRKKTQQNVARGSH
jgi:hypothetical protein